MAENEIKIMNVECGEDGHNPIWGGISSVIHSIGIGIVLVSLALSVNMCQSDIGTISRAWYGQTECSKTEKPNGR